MPIRNGRFINCDMRITPWILGEDALDKLEGILCDYEIPYIVKMTEGYNRSVWVPRAYRRYLPRLPETIDLNFQAFIEAFNRPAAAPRASAPRSVPAPGDGQDKKPAPAGK